MDFSVDESPAVKALGPLFKLTEVHLWDDASSAMQESPYVEEPIKLSDKDYGQSDNTRINGFDLLPEDVELAKELNDLGLPLSFRTNKETRQGMTCGKRKVTRKKSPQSPIEFNDYLLDSVKVSEEENISPARLLNTPGISDRNEIPDNGILANGEGLSSLSVEWGDSMNSTACTSTLSNEHDNSCEVSHLCFGHSLGYSSRLGNDMSDEAESTQCTDEMMATGLCLDGGTSEESFLVQNSADFDTKDKKGEPESVLLEALLITDHDPEAQSSNISLDAIQDSDLAACSQYSEQATSSLTDNHQTNPGTWITYWDDFYMRNYFYNVETKESTWEPPSGMEHQAYGNLADEQTNLLDGAELDNDQMHFLKFDEVQASSDVQPNLYSAEESTNDNWPLDQQLDMIAGNRLSADNVTSVNIRQREVVMQTKSTRKLSSSSEDLQGVEKVLPTISKYWCQRYILFSRFDYGIKMDEEGWFSVTPETLAKHHAVRCGSGAIVDFFTGVGGNAIQFAQRSKHVIAIDIDPNKIDYARHNAAIYGVEDNIDFMKGDSFSLAPNLKANTVFMSPPWGGPAYSKVKKFDINTMLKPREGQFLFNAGKGIAPKIVMFLPRNVDINQLAEISLSASPPWSLEVERNFLNGRFKAVTAYFTEPSMS